METDQYIPTSTTHPYLLDSIDQLPALLRPLAAQHLPQGQTVVNIFVIPPDAFRRGYRWQPVPLRALIFTSQGILQVTAAQRGGAGRVVWVAVEDMLKVKLSLILLYGRLEIWSVRGGEKPAIDVEYNAVGHSLLEPSLHELLRHTWKNDPTKKVIGKPDASFDQLSGLSYSFYNGLVHEALQQGEAVLGYLYQPEIEEPWLHIFNKKLYKKVFPKIAVALTDKQLIFLREDLQPRIHHEWIFTFIPLHRIASITQAEYKTWQKISIRLRSEPAQTPIELMLNAAQAQKFTSFWKEIVLGPLE
jgi:hypothetical protein